MGKKRKQEGVQEAPRARRSGVARLLAVFLGLLMGGCAGVAVVAFAMPALLDGVVTLPTRTVGYLGAGGAVVSLLLMVLVVSRTRRRVAEAEFSRPELISVPVSDVEENAPLFPAEGEGQGPQMAPVPAAGATVTNGPVEASIFAPLIEAAAAEPAPPLPDEVSFAPAAVAAPTIPAPPVQPTPFAELAPEPDPVAPDPVSEADAPQAPWSTSELEVLSGAWFAGPSKHRK